MTGPDPSTVLVEGPWTHRAVAANGARFHVAEAGAGPLMLLLHGFPVFWWTWRHQLVSLAGAGFRVAAMDLRGYGDSDKPPRGYDPFTLTGDVAGVIRSLGATEAIVVGHGWGGLIGWTCAALEPRVVARLVVVGAAHPRRFRAAAARSARQLAAFRHVVGFQLPWQPERRLVAEDGAYVERLLRAWSGGPAWPDAATAARYRAAMQVDAVAHSSLEYHRWAVRSLPRPDGIRFARRMRTPVACPVLALRGERDPAVLAGTTTGSGRYVTGSYTCASLPGVGHFPQEEDPSAFDAALLGWLARPETG